MVVVLQGTGNRRFGGACRGSEFAQDGQTLFSHGGKPVCSTTCESRDSLSSDQPQPLPRGPEQPQAGVGGVGAIHGRSGSGDNRLEWCAMIRTLTRMERKGNVMADADDDRKPSARTGEPPVPTRRTGEPPVPTRSWEDQEEGEANL